MQFPLKDSLPPIVQSKVELSPHLREISLAILDEVVQYIAQKHEDATNEDELKTERVVGTITVEAVFEEVAGDVPPIAVVPPEETVVIEEIVVIKPKHPFL